MGHGIYCLGDLQPQLPEDGSHWIAPTASVIGNVHLSANCSIWFGAVLRGDNDLISVGEGTNIQDMAMCHVDPGVPLTVGARCTIGHKAILHGCTIGDGTLIGMGATVLNGAKIGRNCLIGAGALVTEGVEIPDGHLVVGSPARVKRPLSEAHLAGLARSAEVYIANAARFREGLRALS